MVQASCKFASLSYEKIRGLRPREPGSQAWSLHFLRVIQFESFISFGLKVAVIAFADIVLSESNQTDLI